MIESDENSEMTEAEREAEVTADRMHVTRNQSMSEAEFLAKEAGIEAAARGSDWTAIEPPEKDPEVSAIIREVQKQNAAIIEQNSLILRTVLMPAFIVASRESEI